MLQYERIDFSEGIDVNKTNLSKEYDICHYWCFKDTGFKYEPYVCNGYDDLMQESIIIILPLYMFKENSYRIHFWYMSKDDAINIMTGSNLVDKRVVL